jgi:hypothetical protein
MEEARVAPGGCMARLSWRRVGLRRRVAHLAIIVFFEFSRSLHLGFERCKMQGIEWTVRSECVLRSIGATAPRSCLLHRLATWGPTLVEGCDGT